MSSDPAARGDRDRAARAQDDVPSMHSRIPTESREGSWLRRCARTLWGVLVSPRNLFARCPEPVDHGKALRFLATLRLFPWAVLIVLLSARLLLTEDTGPVHARSIYYFVDPALTRALSVWLLVMVPVGMPVLYFSCGLVAHVAVGLTGGASRSVGASMRAVGYAMAPALLGIALLDFVLYTVGIDGKIYLAIVPFLTLSFLWAAGVGLARTHQIHLLRGFLVAVLPTALLLGAFVGRAALEVESMPGLPEPSSPYWVP